MLTVEFEKGRNAHYNVLCLGAHSDDIEIGCGGTILKLIEKYPNLSVYWVVFSANPQRAAEAERSAATFLQSVADKTVVVKDFKDGFFPYTGSDVKGYFEELQKTFSPDLIFTHYRHDLHQDHRTLCELTWNTFRNHFILEYEIPKYDGDLGNPNLFVHLDEATCNRKVKALMTYFGTQENKHWFNEETFLSIMRLRGIESKAPDKYAEAFHCRKIVW